MFNSDIIGINHPQMIGLRGHACCGNVSHNTKGFGRQREEQLEKVACGYGSIPINTIFRGMNIHLPAILMFTRGTRF
jgi:hypothetical protein